MNPNTQKMQLPSKEKCESKLNCKIKFSWTCTQSSMSGCWEIKHTLFLNTLTADNLRKQFLKLLSDKPASVGIMSNWTFCLWYFQERNSAVFPCDYVLINLGTLIRQSMQQGKQFALPDEITRVQILWGGGHFN